MLGLREDGDIVKTRDLQRPLPSHFRFRSVVWCAGEGGEKDSYTARGLLCCIGGADARGRAMLVSQLGDVAEKEIFSGDDASPVACEAKIREPFRDCGFCFRRIGQGAGKSEVRE